MAKFKIGDKVFVRHFNFYATVIGFRMTNAREPFAEYTLDYNHPRITWYDYDLEDDDRDKESVEKWLTGSR